jgi:hypothetical protein
MILKLIVNKLVSQKKYNNLAQNWPYKKRVCRFKQFEIFKNHNNMNITLKPISTKSIKKNQCLFHNPILKNFEISDFKFCIKNW